MELKDITLSIVVPCYNEKNNIKSIIDKVLEIENINKEIIVVDDFSQDGTREILENEIAPLVSKIIYHEKNQGKGAALRTGFKEVTGDFVIVQDADLEYSPSEYEKLLQPLLSGQADVVYGSRFLNNKCKGYKSNILANKFLTGLSNLFTHLHLTDMETCYKMFRADIIKNIEIKENRFGFEPEITAKIAKEKVRVQELPISYNPRTVEEGKKINYKDGLRAIYCIWKYRK